MTKGRSTISGPAIVYVAIDVAKAMHHVLIESPDGRRRALRVANTREGIDALIAMLRMWAIPCEIAFEPTGDYHRPIAYWLGAAGFHLQLVSSLAVARTREARYNTWDKNDPKDAQVILHLLKTGSTQPFIDPGIGPALDLQEIAKSMPVLTSVYATRTILAAQAVYAFRRRSAFCGSARM